MIASARSSKTARPRRRAPLYFGGAEHPEASASSLKTVIPTKAGIQRLQVFSPERPWIPASAGMTSKGQGQSEGVNPEPSAPSPQDVIPAKAGIQRLQVFSPERPWIPASAGMTSKGQGQSEGVNPEPSAPSPQYVIPAKAGIQRLQRHFPRTSFPRRRAPLYFGVAEHPEASARAWGGKVGGRATHVSNHAASSKPNVSHHNWNTPPHPGPTSTACY
ncbi:hypothetical protein [Lysobacter gummosus]|uniref:hypothetical protein n=1 Tax=Lysobacter gummosus TaxID=262324 RepID=UPI0036270D34